MSYWGYYYKPSRPRQVKGGIKSQSKSGGFGKRESFALVNAFSMSSGISPFRSLALNTALEAIAAMALFQPAAGMGFTPIDTLYGVAREPCTRAATRPSPMSMETTCPRRA